MMSHLIHNQKTASHGAGHHEQPLYLTTMVNVCGCFLCNATVKPGQLDVTSSYVAYPPAVVVLLLALLRHFFCQ